MKRVAFWSFLVLVALFCGFKAFDLYLGYAQPTPYVKLLQKPSILDYELYPYTGVHIRANFHQKGPMPTLWADEPVDVKTGPFGMFLDFSSDSPPLQQQRLAVFKRSGLWNELRQVPTAGGRR